MAKTRNKQDIPNEVIEKIANEIPLYGGVANYRGIDDFNFQEAARGYQQRIPEYAVQNMTDSGVFYDQEGQERPISQLDPAGFMGGVNDTDKLLRISTDILLPDGSLVSERETQKAIENGISPDFAPAVGQMAAKDLAQRTSARRESVASILDLVMLGDTFRGGTGAAIEGEKLVPYFHPEKQEWVMKIATPEDLKAGRAAVSAYGPQDESTNFVTAFTQGLNRGLARTIPSLFSFNEMIGDIAEGTWNFATDGEFKTEEGTADATAKRFQDAFKDLAPMARSTEDPFGSIEGFTGALGQGVASLLQYGAIGRLGTGFGLTTGAAATKLLGTNAVNNLSRAGMMTAGMVLNSGESYEAAKEAGLDEGDAALMGLATGVINTALEMGFGANNLQRYLVGGKGAKELPRIILQETGGDMSKLASKQANIIQRMSQKVDNFLKTPIIGTAIEEGSEEFMQSLVNSTGQFLYNYTNIDKGQYGEGIYEPKNMADVFKDAFAEAAIGAIIGGAVGITAKNNLQERQSVMPFIVEGKSDMVKSTLAEMLEKQQIDGNSYQNFVDRIDKLDQIWNTNSDVFDAASKLNEDEAVRIKTNALALIDQEFDIKQQREGEIAKIREIQTNPDLSDAVKEEKVKEIQIGVNNLNQQVQAISNKISEYIPDDSGRTRILDRVTEYNKFRDYIIKQANNIVPINEEEYDTIFNYSSIKPQLDELLEKSIDEGFTGEIKGQLKELTGLNNKDNFIENVVQTRQAITELKLREKQKQIESENRAVKKRQQDIKNKAKKTKEADTLSQTDTTTKETEVTDELNIPDATLEPIEGVEPEISSSETLSQPNDIVTPPTIETPVTGAQTVNYKNNNYNITDDGRIINTKTNREINPESAVGKNVLNLLEQPTPVVDDIVPIQPTEQSLLTPEEQAVIKILDSEDIQTQTEEINTDGYVTNDLQAEPKAKQIEDLSRKRQVGNTIISLNIDYRRIIDEEAGTSDIVDQVDDEGNPIINQNFDSRLQDPNQFNTGSSTNIIVPSYSQMMKAGMRTDYTQEEYQQDLSNSEKLPIAFTDNTGKIIGYLPTTQNVRDRVQEDVKDAEIIKNQELRNFIAANPNINFTTNITRKSTGTPLFVRTEGKIYDRLGNGERLSEGVQIGVYKNGRLLNGLNSTIETKIALPEGMSKDDYFQEGVVYTVIPTADGISSFAFASNINPIGTPTADSIVRMIQLFRANPEFSRDNTLIQERNKLSSEIDFSNYQQFMTAVENIIYVNNNNPNSMFQIDSKSSKLRLGITKDKVFDLKDIMTNTEVQNKVAYELAGRYPSVRLSSFGQRFNTYELINNELQQRRYRNYFDYLNDKSIIQTRLQGQPIEGTDNMYFTAQSIIEFSNPVAVTESTEEAIQTTDKPSTFTTTKRVSKTGAKLKPKKQTKPDIENDFDLLNNIDENLDTQAENLMRICKSG